MSRLVDADALIEVIKESRPLNWTDSESELQEDADYNHFIEMVNAQPTAYDVGKVVAELGNATQYVDLSNPSSPIRHGVKALHPRVAIEIVKRGGVE